MVAYLDAVIVFDSDPTVHIKTVRALLLHLHKHNLMFSPSKARLGATDANCLGHSISHAGIRPNAEKVLDLIKRPCPSTSSRSVR